MLQLISFMIRCVSNNIQNITKRKDSYLATLFQRSSRLHTSIQIASAEVQKTTQ